MDILVKKNKLEVSFSALIFPDGTINSPHYNWNFGDGSIVEDQPNPTHTYSASGFYLVNLTVNYTDSENIAKSLVETTSIVISDKVETTLSNSIYQLFRYYIPDGITITQPQIRFYIEKWQLYILPLLNHELESVNATDELYYEALENQLIVELSAYDYLKVLLQQLLMSIQGKNIAMAQNNSEEGGGPVKKIVTGPSEVEFYDQVTESQVSSYKILTAAFQKDGTIDNLRKDLCMLATRLDIYLPICKNDTVEKPGIEVANRRDPGLLGGPNPPFLVTNDLP